MDQWIEHESWLSPDGKTVCARCNIELPRLLPVQQTICTRSGWVTMGRRPDAVRCKEGTHGRP